MLVVAPIVILAIGAFLTVIINMTGSVIASRAANALSYNVQDALNRIEQDVKQSSSFLASNNVTIPAANAQGYNDDTTTFTNVGGTSNTSIILNMVATTGNPLSTSSGYVFLKNRPNPCGTAQNNTPLTYNVVYFIKDATLWRRTIMPTNYTDTTNIVCATPFQQPSCSPTYMANNPGTTFCKTNDIKLVDGITPADFSIRYYNGESASTENTPASTTSVTTADRNTALQSATTVSVSINAKQTAAGRDIERLAVLRVSRLDTNASSIAVITADGIPAAPAVSIKAVAGANANVGWPAVSGASGYTLQYNINGGAWQTRFTNQNTRSAIIQATANEDTINVRVTATGTAGTSGYGTASVTIPQWETILLQNTWTDFSPEYTSAQYTKTKAGVVMVKGLIKRTGGAAVVGEFIGNLPDGYRPEGGTLLFGTSSAGYSARVDVAPDGNMFMSSGDAAWLSLDTIRFVPAGRYTRTAMSPYANGYSNWDTASWAGGSYVTDSAGRVNLQGLIRYGSPTSDNTRIFDLPAALLPSQYMHVSSRAEAYGFFGIDSRAGTSGVVAKASGTGYLALNTIYYPASYNSWNNLSMVNGWGAYPGVFTTPQYTKSAVDNVVTLKGLIRRDTAAGSGSAMAVLPVGSRPKERILFATASMGDYSRIDILPNGEVQFLSGSNGWLTLDGISFKGEQ